jgi:hypothetical protein
MGPAQALEAQLAKGQLRSNREKKKPKADKSKSKTPPATSPFSAGGFTAKPGQGGSAGKKKS